MREHLVFADGALVLQHSGRDLARVRLLTGQEGAFQQIPVAGPVALDEASAGVRAECTLSFPEAGFWTLRLTLRNDTAHPLSFDRIRLEVVLSLPVWGHALWAMQGAAVQWGQEFAFPLENGFQRENYLGHLQDAEGGGVPVAYLWNREHGLALMHLETAPIEWYMPLERDETSARMAFELRRSIVLSPGEAWISPLFALSWHERSDFFAPLERYRQEMQKHGISPAAPVAASYEPVWCSWGYEFDITAQDVESVLPLARSMGLRWFTLDDRWFDAYGDWNPRADLFPNGAEDLKRMNAAIHAAGGFLNFGGIRFALKTAKAAGPAMSIPSPICWQNIPIGSCWMSRGAWRATTGT